MWDLDAGVRLRLGRRCPDVGPPPDDKDAFSEFGGHPFGDRQTEETGADDEEVVHGPRSARRADRPGHRDRWAGAERPGHQDRWAGAERPGHQDRWAEGATGHQDRWAGAGDRASGPVGRSGATRHQGPVGRSGATRASGPVGRRSDPGIRTGGQEAERPGHQDRWAGATGADRWAGAAIRTGGGERATRASGPVGGSGATRASGEVIGPLGYPTAAVRPHRKALRRRGIQRESRENHCPANEIKVAIRSRLRIVTLVSWSQPYHRSLGWLRPRRTAGLGLPTGSEHLNACMIEETSCRTDVDVKLSTAMSAVAALAVASPFAVVGVMELTAGPQQAPEHRDFVRAAVVTDLPNELLSALQQGLSQFGINLPPLPTGLSPAGAQPVQAGPALTTPSLTAPGLTTLSLGPRAHHTPAWTTPGLTTPRPDHAGAHHARLDDTRPHHTRPDDAVG